MPVIILSEHASVCGAESTTYRYGATMYTERIYMSRVHGDGRNGLVACGTEEAVGAAGPGRVGPALRREPSDWHLGWNRRPGQHLDKNGCPSQRFGWKRKPSQHLDRTDVRVSTSDGNGSRVNTSTGAESESAPRKAEVESTPRNIGKVVWFSSQFLECLGKEWSRLSKLADLYTPERPMVRPGSACGAQLFVR